VRRLEHRAVLDADAGEVGDLEEAPELISSDHAPVGEPVVLALEQPVQRHGSFSGRSCAWSWDQAGSGDRSSMAAARRQRCGSTCSRKPRSPYARYFDIDWSRGKFAPSVLGKHYARSGSRRAQAREHRGRVEASRYFDHRFPLDPKTTRQAAAA